MDSSRKNVLERPSRAARWGLGFSIAGLLLPVLCGLVVGSTAAGTSYTTLGWFIGVAFGLLPGVVFGLLGSALGTAVLVQRGWRGHLGVPAVVVGLIVVLAGLAFFVSMQ